MGRCALRIALLATIALTAAFGTAAHSAGDPYEAMAVRRVAEHGPAAFGVRAHPNTILIDRQGRIVGRVLGERQWDSAEANRLIEILLTGAR